MTTRLITWGAMIGAATALMLSLAILLAAGPQRPDISSRPLLVTSDALELPVAATQADTVADTSGLLPSTLRSAALFQVSLR